MVKNLVKSIDVNRSFWNLSREDHALTMTDCQKLTIFQFVFCACIYKIIFSLKVTLSS